jgi:hypothetical protein
MLAESSTSPTVWGSLYTYKSFCCCFDSSAQLSDVIFHTVRFSITNAKDKTDPETFLKTMLARLLDLSPNSIFVLDSTTEDKNYLFNLAFTNGEFTSAKGASSLLSALDGVHFEHLGAQDFTILDFDPTKETLIRLRQMQRQGLLSAAPPLLFSVSLWFSITMSLARLIN